MNSYGTAVIQRDRERERAATLPHLAAGRFGNGASACHAEPLPAAQLHLRALSLAPVAPSRSLSFDLPPGGPSLGGGCYIFERFDARQRLDPRRAFFQPNLARK
ncbi:Hypothetical protein NTJ_15491 [Nesidiocoris tenuis]|uniref:Uncharacterized protein n=1 Tax=Nesidiocoris tenuis TaxID=355587 RepID=A0ABN7BE74_9HEMI|nr:Hypothetical protein NTJ_15491 [Nesidiocoris tenuis]